MSSHRSSPPLVASTIAAAVADAVASTVAARTPSASRELKPLPEVPEKRKRSDFADKAAYEAYRKERRTAQMAVHERSRTRLGRTHPARDQQQAARALEKEQQQAARALEKERAQKEWEQSFASSQSSSAVVAVAAKHPLQQVADAVVAVSEQRRQRQQQAPWDASMVAARTVAVVQAARARTDRCTTTVVQRSGTVYCGELEHGKPHGFGVCEWPCGERYEGQWCNARREGYGTCTLTNSDIFVGTWENDLKEGLGQTLYGSHRPNPHEDTMAGCVEISYYEANEPVGENVVWEPDRMMAARWTPDDRLERISLELAKDIETRLLKGRPLAFA